MPLSMCEFEGNGALRVNHACCKACTTSIGYIHGVLCSKVYSYNMNALATLISACLYPAHAMGHTGRDSHWGEHQAGGEVPHELICTSMQSMLHPSSSHVCHMYRA